MTPVSSLGVPLTGGLVAAVQLEPDGLELAQPATLTIEPPASIPIAEQTAFTYEGNGQNFSLASLANSTEITFNLLHFCANGLESGAPSQPISPATAQAKFLSEAAQLLEQQRTCVLAGTGCDPPFDSKLEVLEQLYLEQVVVPLLQQALSDYTVASSAIATALVWLPEVSIANPADGLKEPFATDQGYIMQTISKILTNAFKQIYGKCAETSNSGQRQDYAVQLLGIARNSTSCSAAQSSTSRITRARF